MRRHWTISGALLGLILCVAPLRAADGPYLLTDIHPGPLDPLFAVDFSAPPSGFFQIGSLAFFSTANLWVTDGTPEGTRRVADLAPGGLAGLSYYYFGGAAAFSNGVLYFDADDGTTGVEPWALRVEP
jgi:ELWxxDGT repeat protein